MTRYSRKAFRQVQANLGTLNAVMEENIAGVRVVKAFAREEETIAQFETINADNRQVGIKADIITAALGPMFTTMRTITIAVVALLGGWLSLQGIVSVGVIATFVVYIMNFFRPMRGIAMLYNDLQSALAGAERIFEVLDEQARPWPIRRTPSRCPQIRGEVTFDNVSFAYEADKPVLEDVNLTATTGPDHRAGRPHRRGQDDHHQPAEPLLRRERGRDPDRRPRHPQRGADIDPRAAWASCLQDTFLFSETVMENIRYGRLDGQRRGGDRGGPTGQCGPLHPHAAPGLSAPRSRSRGTTSARGSASCWPLPAPCWPTRAS